MVASITEIEATSGQEIMQLLQQGNARRSQAATAANEVSSRSHAVLQVVVRLFVYLYFFFNFPFLIFNSYIFFRLKAEIVPLVLL